jgi:hypothetical protein
VNTTLHVDTTGFTRKVASKRSQMTCDIHDLTHSSLVNPADLFIEGWIQRPVSVILKGHPTPLSISDFSHKIHPVKFGELNVKMSCDMIANQVSL